LSHKLDQLDNKEKLVFWGLISVFVCSSIFWFILCEERFLQTLPSEGGQYVEGIIGQPSILNPIFSFSSPDKDVITLLFKDYRQISHCQLVEKKNYICSLKENARWDNGQPITSDDIMFTVNLIQNPSTSSYLYKTFKNVHVEKISKLKVKFILKNPYSFFLDNLKKLYIIPKKAFENVPLSNLSLSKYNLQPIGNGLFKFKEFKSRENGYIYEYSLKRNAYSLNKPYLSEVIFKFYKNEDELISAYNQGEIDGFASFAPFPLEKIKRKYKIKKFITPEFFALFLNQNDPLMQNESIKGVLFSSINKSEIIDKVLNGQGVEIDSPLVPGSPYYFTTEIPEFSASKPPMIDNFKSISLSITLPDDEILKKTAQLIKRQIEDSIAGEVKLKVLSPREMKLAIQTRDYQILLFGIRPMANFDFFPLFHSSQKFDPGVNLSLYGKEESDNLLEELRKTFDPLKQKEYTQLFLKNLSLDKPCIFLFSPLYLYVTSSKIKGIKGQFIEEPGQRFKHISFWFSQTKQILR